MASGWPTAWIAAAALIALATGARAQAPQGLIEIDRRQPVALVADQVSFDEPSGVVRAEGDVEVYYGARTLTATAIEYDSKSDRLSATGPITLRDGAGITIYADMAELDSDLRDGVARGARALIADGAGQMAAVEARRVEGRYTAFEKAVYSSCSVCAADPTPTWRVRAGRAVHDAEDKVMHFENVTFDIFGLPVGWLPYFSLPDPSVKRASGFLAPTFLSDSAYGYAIKIPYFITLGPSRDATLTLFPTTNDGVIVEGEYRQALDAGAFWLRGSGGHLDDKISERFRWHLFGEGDFNLSDRFDGEASAGFRLGLASDESYTRRYDIDNRDRLENELFFNRYDGRDYDEISALYVQSLRRGENDAQIAMALPDFALRRVYDAPGLGGEAGFTLSGVQLIRRDGRDMGRLSLGADWERRFALESGLALRAFAAARGDLYRVTGDDRGRDGTHLRFAPRMGGDIRYPLISVQGEATQLIEPVVQFVAAPADLNPSDIPNEDSRIVEFDETNLFDINRFPGFDRIESGSRINLGARYQLQFDSGFRLEAAGGRSFRLSRESSFSVTSGLQDRRSDYVAALSLGMEPWFDVTSRLRLSDEFQINRADLSGRAQYEFVSFSASYFFLESDATAGALNDQQQLAAALGLQLTDQWRVGASALRDMEESRFINVGATIGYTSECVGVEAFIKRDFTATRGAPASTTYGARVRLFGLADGAGARSDTCASRYALNQ